MARKPAPPAADFPLPPKQARLVLDGKAVIKNYNDQMFWVCRPNGHPLEWKPSFDGAVNRARELIEKGAL